MFHTVIREMTSSCKKSKQMQTVKVTGGTKTLITDRKSEYLTSTRVREYSSQCESQCKNQRTDKLYFGNGTKLTVETGKSFLCLNDFRL